MSDVPFEERPRLRSVEMGETQHEGETLYVVMDPSGLAPEPAVLSGPGIAIVQLMDGHNTLEDIQEKLLRHLGLVVPWEPIRDLIVSLDEAKLLESAGFRRYWNDLPARPPLRLLPDDALEPNRKMFRAMVDSSSAAGNGNGRIAGLIAPHLDYDRGHPCYADAYRLLSARNTAKRFIILGTNHFYPTFELSATAKDFRTPLGIARNDTAFLRRVEERMGADLCRNEFAHIREHSIELQVRFLQHLLGTENFSFVPFLCPDPCLSIPGFDAWAESDRFAAALRETIAGDDVPTCVIAGADLSHIGRNFGDKPVLSDGWLADIGGKDRTLLSHVETGRPAELVAHLKSDQNARRVCSAGCISTLMKTLNGKAKPKVLRYHQAVNHETQTAVTCCAAVFEE
jgi:hypothetical protein